MNHLLKNTYSNKTLSIQSILTIFALYLLISNLFPPMKAVPAYQITVFLIMFLWISSVFIIRPYFFININLHVLCIYFFIIYTAVTPYLFDNDVIGNRYLQLSLMFVFYLIFVYNEKYGYEKSSKMILIIALLFVLITSITTLIGLFENPYLSRSIKSSGEHSQFLNSQGIGGYEFIYFLVFIVIILYYILINARNFKLKLRTNLLFIGLFIIFLTTVVFSNYFTALILLMIGVTIVTLGKKRNLIINIFIILGITISVLFIKQIFFLITNGLLKILENGSTYNKIKMLQLEVNNEGTNQSITSERFSTIDNSVDAFIQNPIFGIVTDKINFTGGYLTGFGQHSYFVDTFALFGILIGILNIYIVFQPMVIKMFKKNILWILNLALFVTTLLLFFANNASPSIGIAIFFVYPVIYNWLLEILEVNNKKYN